MAADTPRLLAQAADRIGEENEAADVAVFSVRDLHRPVLPPGAVPPERTPRLAA
jgi:hypothetical protein